MTLHDFLDACKLIVRLKQQTDGQIKNCCSTCRALQ